MACKCKGLCSNELDGGKGMTFKTHAWCKLCQKWIPKPTDIRHKCCNQILRTNPRSSKVRSSTEFKRIE